MLWRARKGVRHFSVWRIRFMVQASNQRRQGEAHDAGKGTDSAPGQQEQHEVRNPATGERRMVTQEQWRNRASDPELANFVRTDGDTTPPADATTPEAAPATPTE